MESQNQKWGYLSVTSLGALLAALNFSTLIVSPISGWIGDRFGEIAPASGGLFLSMIGLIGLAVDTNLDTAYWHLALWMTIIGVGSGFFNSPNSSSLMNAAGPKYRGEAPGIRSLVVNMGMMFSIAFTMPLVTSSIPREDMLAIFSSTEGGISGAQAAQTLHGFITGLHDVFWSMAGLMLLATIVSLLRGKTRIGETSGKAQGM